MEPTTKSPDSKYFGASHISQHACNSCTDQGRRHQMQFDIFLVLCDHYLAEQNCSKTEVQVLRSLPLILIFSYYIFKAFPLLARNLENTSLPLTSSSPSVWLRRCYTHKYIRTSTYVYISPSHSLFHSLSEGASNSHLS